MKRVLLQSPDQIRDLIKRSITTVERPAHLSSCVVPLVTDPINQKVDAFLRCHLFEVKTERENDAGAPMHSPKEHADAILRRFGKLQIPEQQLPIERITLRPDRCAEQPAIRSVARGHETLEMVSGN